jgi:hypothetical protein
MGANDRFLLRDLLGAGVGVPFDHGNGMLNPNDVTIDIPLTETTSRGQTGARKWDTCDACRQDHDDGGQR